MKSTRKRKPYRKKSRKVKKMEKRRTRVKKMRRLKKSGKKFVGGIGTGVTFLEFDGYELLENAIKKEIDNTENIGVYIRDVFNEDIVGYSVCKTIMDKINNTINKFTYIDNKSKKTIARKVLIMIYIESLIRMINERRLSKRMIQRILPKNNLKLTDKDVVNLYDKIDYNVLKNGKNAKKLAEKYDIKYYTSYTPIEEITTKDGEGREGEGGEVEEREEGGKEGEKVEEGREGEGMEEEGE